VNNPTLVNWNTSVATFYNNVQNGLIGKFYAVEKGIRGLNTPSSPLSTSYNALLDDLEAIGIAINEIDIQLESANEAQTTTLLAEREDLLEQVEQRLGQLDEVKGQIASEKTGRIAQLLSDNTAIVPVASYQGYQKTVFEIYLQTVASDNTSFSTSQQASLSDISSKCPSTDGVGVYWARYLRQYYEPEWVSPLDDCGLLSLRSQEVTAEGRPLSGISLFPNPANNSLQLTMGMNTSPNITVSIFDALGKNYLNKEFDLSNEPAEIDVSGLAPGIYFYAVKDGSTIFHTQKLSIVR
jgi:exonuclease VII small subunit